MKKILYITLIILFCCTFDAYSACTGSSPTWSCSADTSSSDLQTCINSATAGDTINIAAGNGTWDSTLTITRPIVLVGQGIGNTVITGSVAGFMIHYAPTTPNINNRFRVTGFTLDGNSTSAGIWIDNQSTTGVIERIRIDHNRIVNPGYTGRSIQADGVYGVVDNNVMDNSIMGKAIDVGGSGDITGIALYNWSTAPDFGIGHMEECLYIENNTITTKDTISSSGGGSRRCFRYNTVTLANTAIAGLVPMIDAHGNFYPWTSSSFSSQVSDTYGNLFDLSEHRDSGDQHTMTMVDLRGGTGKILYNKSIQQASSNLSTNNTREEQSDYATGYPTTPDGQPQRVSEAYSINNRQTGNAQLINFLSTPSQNACSDAPVSWTNGMTIPVAYMISVFSGNGGNICYTGHNACTTGSSEPTWNKTNGAKTDDGTCEWTAGGAGTTIVQARDSSNYVSTGFDPTDGTNSSGCGASLPASCTYSPTVLVGYFVPDNISTMPCSSLSDNNVGATVTVPVTGSLYKCTATDTWTKVWETYTYPHPLRGESPADTTAPTVTISTSNSTITSDSLAVTGTSVDAVGVSGCKFRIGSAPDAGNGTACTGTTSFSCATSGYASGANTLYVGCYDAAGNYGSDSIIVTFTPPTASGCSFSGGVMVR